jgi:hypothetical protein
MASRMEDDPIGVVFDRAASPDGNDEAAVATKAPQPMGLLTQ